MKVTAGASFCDRFSALSSKDPFLPLSKDGAEAQAAINRIHQSSGASFFGQGTEHPLGDRGLANSTTKHFNIQFGAGPVQPSYQTMMAHDSIVSHNHLSEMPCVAIEEEQLTYGDRNYLTRDVVNPSDLE